MTETGRCPENSEACLVPRIVLAEDSPADVMLVRLALKKTPLPCHLHVLADGERVIECVEQVDANPDAPLIDLLLLDMHLPKCGGKEIMERLRSTKYHARTPVIVMSSSDSPKDLEQARQHGARHFFRKPSDLAQFMKLGTIIKAVLASPIELAVSEAGV